MVKKRRSKRRNSTGGRGLEGRFIKIATAASVAGGAGFVINNLGSSIGFAVPVQTRALLQSWLAFKVAGGNVNGAIAALPFLSQAGINVFQSLNLGGGSSGGSGALF